jgi:hypothetical protein
VWWLSLLVSAELAVSAGVIGIPPDLIDALSHDPQIEQSLKDCPTSEQSPKGNFTFEPFDLPNQSGWLLTGTGCLAGANSNPILLYIHDAGGWRKILDSNGEGLSPCEDADPPCSPPEAPKGHPNDFPDLALEAHYSADATSQTVFHYDGKVYREARCYSVSYKDQSGKALAKPLIKPLSLDNCYRGY